MEHLFTEYLYISVGANYAIANPIEILKAIIVSPRVIQVKTRINGVVSVKNIDFSNIMAGISYTSESHDLIHNISHVKDDWGEIDTIAIQLNSNVSGGNTVGPGHEYPKDLYLAQDETTAVEPANETIIYPPPETTEQFFERVWARLLHLTRRIKILRHEEPHQNALSEKICREIPADHDEVLRYDIACNLIKRPCGWLALQLENYQNRYTRHLESVVKANEAGRTPPTFNRGTDETKIETMLEKLENNLTEECLQEHFDLHDHAVWNKVQNEQRKITLCGEDNSPGEVLVDVNAFFTDGRGNIAETHAKRTYHDISTKYWMMAKRTPHRELVTSREVSI